MTNRKNLMSKITRTVAAVTFTLVLIHTRPAANAASALKPSEAILLPVAPDSFLGEPLLSATSSNGAAAAGLGFRPMHRSVAQLAAETSEGTTGEAAGERTWRTRWLVSVGPLVAAQSLDAASSYGLREMNPLLASPDGRFGMKATALKFGVIGGLVGAEALLVRKFPRSAKFFTVVNYSTAGVTTGLAVYNYRLPGR